MDKFKYAAGLPGYGTPGIDGSAGSNGLSMYFTDLDTVNDQIAITSKISANEYIWSVDSSTLPAGKTYQTGDLFVDSKGRIYKIDLNLVNLFTPTSLKLSASQLFTDSGSASLELGLERWSNTFNANLIDTVLTENEVDYTTSPTGIYNTSPLDFARIEYADAAPNSFNPFTVYVGDNINNESALAIVRSTGDGVFHLGNLNDTLTDARNTDLTFDVRNLIVSKNPNSQYNDYEAPGTVVTNYEMGANPLFTPNFTLSPSSFLLTPIGTTQLDVSWNMCEFLNTVDANILNNTFATLYFYPYKSWNGTSYSYISPWDTSTLICNNLDVSGKISITNLPQNSNFGAYINFNYNGWNRTSKILTGTTNFVVTMNVSEHTTHATSITADASGWFSSQSSYVGLLDLSTNAAWTSNNPVNWITLTPIAGNPPYVTLPQIDVSISSTLAHSNRGPATLTFTPTGGSSKTINVTQLGVPYPVTATLNKGTLKDNTTSTYISMYRDGTAGSSKDTVTITGLPADTHFNLLVDYEIDVHNWVGSYVYYNSTVSLGATGKTTTSQNQNGSFGPGAGNTWAGTLTLSDMTAANVTLIAIGLTNTAQNSDTHPWRFDSDVKITGITIQYVSGSNIAVTWSGYNYDEDLTNTVSG
jgi:hypothetical protein